MSMGSTPPPGDAMSTIQISRDAPIAIVDDDASVRDALSLLLKIEGFASEAFGDGDSFLDTLQRFIIPRRH